MLVSFIPWRLIAGPYGQVHNLHRFTTNIVIDSVIVTDREFSLGLSRLVLTNVFCDRQGGLETHSYGTWG